MSSKKKTKEYNIPAPTLPQNKKIKFSFEYYDTSGKYCISCWSQQQIKNALIRLKDISTKSFNELRREGRVYHFYEVVWEKTIEPNGFPDSGVKSLPAFHFALVGVNRQLARVYGAFYLDTFYIVWFDLNHNIWPTLLKHT